MHLLHSSKQQESTHLWVFQTAITKSLIQLTHKGNVLTLINHDCFQLAEKYNMHKPFHCMMPTNSGTAHLSSLISTIQTIQGDKNVNS